MGTCEVKKWVNKFQALLPEGFAPYRRGWHSVKNVEYGKDKVHYIDMIKEVIEMSLKPDYTPIDYNNIEKYWKQRLGEISKGGKLYMCDNCKTMLFDNPFVNLYFAAQKKEIQER